MKFKIIPNEQTPKVSNPIDIKADLKLMEKFASFAMRQHNCAGLSANQVSCGGKRIEKTFFAIKINNFWDIVINPEITEYIGNSSEKVEGCLTWLGKNIIASRYPEINVRHYNLKGDFLYRRVSGWEAQVWQHEYNHLSGVPEIVVSKKSKKEKNHE
jgi:peptide deformylase